MRTPPQKLQRNHEEAPEKALREDLGRAIWDALGGPFRSPWGSPLGGYSGSSLEELLRISWEAPGGAFQDALGKALWEAPGVAIGKLLEKPSCGKPLGG